MGIDEQFVIVLDFSFATPLRLLALIIALKHNLILREDLGKGAHWHYTYS